jgi:hypothetical protein
MCGLLLRVLLAGFVCWCWCVGGRLFNTSDYSEALGVAVVTILASAAKATWLNQVETVKAQNNVHRLHCLTAKLHSVGYIAACCHSLESTRINH